MSDGKRPGIGWSHEAIAWNIANDIPDGAVVNLGVGLPEKVVDYIPQGREVLFHTENGLLGMGPSAAIAHADPELINAGKKCVTAVAGAAYFHHADSFAMIRGGHIDFCVLGAMQVSQTGDLANWTMGEGDPAPAVGGAMDLVAGVRRIFIAMTHCTKSGEPKLLRACTLPLTGKGVVSRVYTDLATIAIGPHCFEVLAMAPGVDRDYLQTRTGSDLIFRTSAEVEANRQ